MNRYIRIGAKLEGWPGQKVFYCYTIRNLGFELSANIVSVSENMAVILICAMSYISYRSDHLVRPFLGKNQKIY